MRAKNYTQVLPAIALALTVNGFSSVGLAQDANGRSWGPYRGANINSIMSETDISEFATLGGNLLRANFAFRPLMSKKAPYDLDGEMLAYLDQLLDWCEKYGIRVIIDPHTTPGTQRNTTMLETDLFWTNFDWHEHLIRLWDHLADRYADRGDVIAGYDLINEPSIPNGGPSNTPADYNLLVQRLVKTIRGHDVVHMIVIEPPHVFPPQHPWPASWLPEAFAYLDPPLERNVAYSPHMYWPGSFTHQGVGTRSRELIPYPGTIGGGKPFDRVALQEVLDPVAEFARKHKVPILLGEFSAPRWTGEHGNRYLADVISIAEQHGWSWAYHSYRAADVWDAEMSNTDRADRTRRQLTPRLELLRKAFHGSIKARKD